jgi:2-polyprenyl-6-hydroxyphenyl methylase/3-demethylubiquinone-9 3-methyltransferase
MTNRSSIDPQEVAYFEALASQWWDVNGRFWPLHRLNALRSAYIAESLMSHFGLDPSLAQPLEGIRVLDLGCGGGLLSEAIARLGATVHGVDVVRKNIEVALRHADGQGLPLSYELASAEVLALRGDQYDVLLNMEVVEHVAELSLFLDACAELVKPEGIMFVATINRTLVSWLTAIVAAEHVFGWLPKGTHRWRQFPPAVQMENQLSDRGFSVVQRTGVLMNPFSRQFRLSAYMGVNYMLAARKTGPGKPKAQ